MEEEEQYLEQLIKYVEYNKLLSVAHRNDFIAADLEKSVVSKTKSGSKPGELRRVKAVKTDDVVNIYDRSVQALEDVKKFQKIVGDAKLFTELDQQQSFYKAKRYNAF
jgi:hypothetical protein